MKLFYLLLPTVVLAAFIAPSPARSNPATDIIIASFEGPTYGDAWVATGDAFGAGPVPGTLTGQQTVTGFNGKGLVNTYPNGDGSRGTLLSPQFPLQRTEINFLIGGGQLAGSVYMALIVDGKVVRKATGNNSEQLIPRHWDVTDLVGKTAQIKIVDQATGGWGHILVDDIIESDTAAGPVCTIDETLVPAQRSLLITKRYLWIPVDYEAMQRHTEFWVEGKPERWEDIPFGVGNTSNYTAYLDVSAFIGKTVTFKCNAISSTSLGLGAISQHSAVPVNKFVYQESLRPQYHFTPQHGWMNDPNGLVYYDGEYHLFFQHDPLCNQWNNLHWGHAVSRDLVHWTQIQEAIYPGFMPEGPYQIYSGSAVVDGDNSGGFRTGAEKPLVAFYTAAGPIAEQNLAYSNDRGRTWTNYSGNPVVSHIIGGNRDPKVVWDKYHHQWVMALFLDGHHYGLLTSADLKHWNQITSNLTIGNTGECPDFYPIHLDGDPNKPKWVFSSADGEYVVGDFDGHNFTFSGPALRFNYGGCYALQTFSGLPASDGRRIQIGWMASDFPGMPFSQQDSVPRELTLRSTAEGPRLFERPVRELAKLRGTPHVCQPVSLQAGDDPLAGITGKTLDIVAEIEPSAGSTLTFSFRGKQLIYTTPKATLLTTGGGMAPMPLDSNGRLRLRILVDTATVEAFEGSGAASLSATFVPKPGAADASLTVSGGSAKIISMAVYPMRSIWSSSKRRALSAAPS